MLFKHSSAAAVAKHSLISASIHHVFATILICISCLEISSLLDLGMFGAVLHPDCQLQAMLVPLLGLGTIEVSRTRVHSRQGHQRHQCAIFGCRTNTEGSREGHAGPPSNCG